MLLPLLGRSRNLGIREPSGYIPDLVAYNGSISSERTVTVTSASTGGTGGTTGSNAMLASNVMPVFNAVFVAAPGLSLELGRGPQVVQAPLAGASANSASQPQAGETASGTLASEWAGGNMQPGSLAAGGTASSNPALPFPIVTSGSAQAGVAGAGREAPSWTQVPAASAILVPGETTLGRVSAIGWNAVAAPALAILSNPATSALLATSSTSDPQGLVGLLIAPGQSSAASQAYQGGGGQVLVGGLGDEVVISSSGRDVLIGGFDVESVAEGQDTAPWSATPTGDMDVLANAMQAWNRTDEDYGAQPHLSAEEAGLIAGDARPEGFFGGQGSATTDAIDSLMAVEADMPMDFIPGDD